MFRLTAVLVVAASFGFASVAHADLISEAQSACRDKTENADCALPEGGPGKCVDHNVGPHLNRLNCEKTVPASASATPAPSASASATPNAPSQSSSSGDNGLAPLPRGACGCRVADDSTNESSMVFTTVSIVASVMVGLRLRRARHESR